MNGMRYKNSFFFFFPCNITYHPGSFISPSIFRLPFCCFLLNFFLGGGGGGWGVFPHLSVREFISAMSAFINFQPPRVPRFAQSVYTCSPVFCQLPAYWLHSSLTSARASPGLLCLHDVGIRWRAGWLGKGMLLRSLSDVCEFQLSS